MAESQKGASSSGNSKEKSSLLDLDIGKDFLSSWKSMSVAEDMDFDFGSVTKGKKKAFSFDKMDMDFNLDGDFDKISSFKVDMSDLDIPSDTKKLENPRKKSKEACAGETRQGKTDHFAFPFDFNELDSISFDSTLKKEDRKSKKNQDREESSNRSGSEGSGIQLNDDVSASEEGITQKLSASGSLTTSKNDIQLGRVGELDSTNEDAPSNCVANENCQSKSANMKDQIAIQGTRISPEKTISTSTEETKQESKRPVKTTSQESYAQEPMLDLSVKSFSRNVSTQETGSDLQEVSTVPAERPSSHGGQNVNVKSIAGLGSNYENIQLENLPSQHMASSQSINSEGNKFVSDNHALVCNKDGAEPAQGDLHIAHTSVTTVSRVLLHHTQPNGENQDSNAKLLSAPLNSGTTVNKLVQENDRETDVIRSRFFKRAGETESQLQQMPLSHKKIASFGSEKIGIVQLSHADENRLVDANDTQSGSKLAGISRSQPRELTRSEPIEIGSQESVKSFNSTWEGINTDGTESRGESLGTSRVHDQDAKKGASVLEGSEKNIKALTPISSHVNPSNLNERTNKSTSQDVNPRLSVSSMTSLQSTKKFCVARNKIAPPNSGTRTTDLSRLRISRDGGSNPDLLKSRFLKDTNSLRKSEQIMELQGNRESKIAHAADTQKQISLTPTLKRKTFEKSNVDLLILNPAKRLSESPKENRNIRELSERVIDKQVFNHENVADDNTRSVISDYDIPTLGIRREVNMTELEMPLVMESESNVEKAEACRKELEAICNMLKKKHEEAKEILVRAIVNNNNLLMLNHPIYEEKKFAALLTSK